jgi:hypothetical protein
LLHNKVKNIIPVLQQVYIISISVGFIGLSISASSNMVDHKVTMMLLISEKILSVLFIQARSIKLYCSKKDII